MERADRETWAKRVERWKESGLTAAEFAAEIGVTPSALSWWKWQLGRKVETEKSPLRRRRAKEVGISPVTFVEMSNPKAVDPIEVVFPSGVRVRVPVGVDSDSLARVLGVLEKQR
jgi:hypothetical protein